jgi:hypothetical protein
MVCLGLVACAGDAPAVRAPAPAPVASPRPVDAAPAPQVASAPPEPVAATSVAPPPPIVAGDCDERRLRVSVTRATGEGSYILRLSCTETTFAVSSDRARPDGQELTAVFKVTPLEWEKAFRAVEDMRWRTYDDACGPGEKKVGQGPGPVYRIEIQDGSDKRSFHCAGVRAFTDPLDRLHERLLAQAPAGARSVVGATASDRTGVAQCDTFLDRYQRCIAERVPPAERPDYEQALADTRVRLRDALVAEPSAGPALIKTCQRLADEAKKGTAKYGCKF